MALFPLPNQPGKQLNNYIRNAQLTDETDSYNGRVDWVPSTSNSVFARYTYSNRNRFIPGNYGGVGDGTAPSASGGHGRAGQTPSLCWAAGVRPSLLPQSR